MDFNELAPGIVVYKNVLPNADKIYNDLEDGLKSVNIEWGKAFVRAGSEVKVDVYSRNTDIVDIPYSPIILDDYSIGKAFATTMSNLFLENFKPREEHYKSLYATVTTSHESYGFLRYGLGQQFTNHVDDHTNIPRRISFVYYINDDYKGGEIEFPRFNIKYKPNANEMLFFPSTFVYNHSVLPVTSGYRYAVVSWLN